jgi:uncharacterized protein YjdB
MNAGATTNLAATLRDSEGAVLSGRTITWTTSAAAVATVSSSGVVTGVGPGTAIITAASGGVSGTATVTVNQAPPAVAVARVKITPTSLTLRDDQTRTLSAQVLDSRGHVIPGRSVTWTTSGSDAVRVTSTSGLSVTLKGSGDGFGITLLTATCEGVSDTIVVTFME